LKQSVAQAGCIKVLYFSLWFLFAFVLSALFGILATNLTLEDIRFKNFKRAWRCWDYPQKLLAVVAGLWLVLFVVGALTSVDWRGMVIVSAFGGAAAPWVWLHFARDFFVNQEQGYDERETLIKTLAHKVWRDQGSPEGHADEHYFQAKEQVKAVERDLVETSAKYAEQALARYKLVSILLGIALLVVTLLPVLKDWLPRAQQFQAFGISLTLLRAQPSDQGSRLNLATSSTGNSGGDRLSDAAWLAYQIAAPRCPGIATEQNAARNPGLPVLSPCSADQMASDLSNSSDLDKIESDLSNSSDLDKIESDLSNFRYLSIFSQDRAYIAWLTYELWGKAPLQPVLPQSVGPDLRRADNLTLKRYINAAEDLLKTGYSPPRWVDIEFDREIISYSTFISKCFIKYAKYIHDPQLFIVGIADSLHTFLQQTKVPSINFEGELARALGSEGTRKICTRAIETLRPDWGPYYDPPRGQSPYPSLIGALYLAAVGAVDSGVWVLENWIDDFNEHHDPLVPYSNPQLGVYLWRAKWGASALPYNYQGFAVPHRQLVSWQFDESNQLGRMLGVDDSNGWMRRCRSNSLSPSTLHGKVGQQLAFRYALERFYLFENLELEDFKDSDLKLGSLTDYLREAEAIRDNRWCLEKVGVYLKSDTQYTSYFRLYTAQLRFNLLASENEVDRCKSSLIETIGQELNEADHFGTSELKPTLLPAPDIWEPHRVRLRLLRKQLVDTKRECQT
jgi:hypothetical protein